MRRILLALALITFGNGTPPQASLAMPPHRIEPPTPRYPNELDGLKLYEQFLSPLEPGHSKPEETKKFLASLTGSLGSDWLIEPQFLCMADSETCSMGGEASLVLLFIGLRPRHVVSLKAIRFPSEFSKVPGVSREKQGSLEIHLDMYMDRAGLQYWVLSEDSSAEKLGDLYRVMYGPSCEVLGKEHSFMLRPCMKGRG